MTGVHEKLKHTDLLLVQHVQDTEMDDGDKGINSMFVASSLDASRPYGRRVVIFGVVDLRVVLAVA